MLSPEVDESGVSIVGLVARFLPPRVADARTRGIVPAGYGVREQCQPFAAAAALGMAIDSPISWGVSPAGALPPGARRFRSPVAAEHADPRWCYVLDDAELHFAGNQYHLMPEVLRRIGPAPVPGLSFFDRPDQQNLLKLHLPYSWRTPAGTALLFLDAINRPRRDGLRVVAGLVETAWYANPVNLVLEIPAQPAAIHVRAGEQIAQAVVVDVRAAEEPVRVAPLDGARAREQLEAIRSWRGSHARQRSAYKRISRSVEAGGDELTVP